MKKILQIVDIPGWAIDRLASAIVLHNPQFEWKRIFVHPRDLGRGKISLAPIREAIAWADVVDAQYWRCLSQLLEMIPELKEKKIVLTHHNEENLLSYDWKDVDMHIAKTRYSEGKLREAGYRNVVYIPNSFNPDFFKWNAEYPPAEKSIGYVGRIVDWKGLKEIARAAYELGVPLRAMGKGNDQGYYDSIPEEHRENIDWSFFEYPDDRINEFYQNVSVYVCNSSPHREVGPLPLIEAMASGVPVITTPCGLARDIAKDRDNMMVVPFGEYEALKDAIQEVLENPGLANDLRQSAFKTIRNYSDGRMALDYARVFYGLMKQDGRPWVSVIIPATLDRLEQVEKILESLAVQEYPNLEVVVVWDELQAGKRFFNKWPFLLRELETGREGYNLAMARNLGVIEAGGELLLFCDSRMLPEPGSLAVFVEKIGGYRPEDKVWIFGDKGPHKTVFVENWSIVRRQQLIDAGMFNERVNEYGGMSQELRSRFIAQGFELIYEPKALCREMIKSSSRGRDRKAQSVRMKILMRKLNFEK